MDSQGTKWRRKIAENFNRLSRVHERHRQTTDGRAIAYSEREREFTFAKNYVSMNSTGVYRNISPSQAPATNSVDVYGMILKFFVLTCLFAKENSLTGQIGYGVERT